MMSIATDDYSQGSGPALKTCSMSCRTTWKAAPGNRTSGRSSGSTLAGASYSEGTWCRRAPRRPADLLWRWWAGRLGSSWITASSWAPQRGCSVAGRRLGAYSTDCGP